MVDNKLSEIQRLFDQATTLPAGDRETFLGAACGPDAALREEVASLLRCRERSVGFLDGQAYDAVFPALGTVLEPSALIGRSIGAYRIERLIGTGGMAVVYLARQQDPDRLVALKLLRPGFTMPGLVTRLRDEAQVLARLRHPGMAQIYEAGCANVDSTAPQPFFAMEYVDGASLVRYADAHELSVPERLELLARVCDALQHAHQQGVIHRDLKPQNILVVDDESGGRPGQPKIIDFGVARLIDEGDATLSHQTTIDQLVGTLSYMSPEQFDDPRDGIDVRSDIYAVGVIGYELLTGSLPHDLRGRSIAEAVRTLAESAPIPPSTRDRALRGDIEIILMTALAGEKERRYQSASGMGADLRHVLRSEPISARPPSFLYDLSRHARRNTLFYGALALAFILLLAGTIGTSIGLVRARRAVDDTEALTSFVGRMIASVDPYQAGQINPSMRTMLDQLSAALDGQLTEDPLVRATLQHFLGCTLSGLGQLAESEPHLREAAATRRSLLGPDHPRTLESMEMLADLTRFRGNNEESRQLLEDIVARRRRLLGADHPDTLRACASLANTYLLQERPAEVRALLEPAWQRARAAYGETDPRTLDLGYWIARARHEWGESREAEPILLKVYEARLADRGESNRGTLDAAANLASVYLMEGRLEEGERLARRTCDVQRELLGDQHPDTLITKLLLGDCAMTLGHCQEAETLYVEAEQGMLRSLGADHPETLRAQIGVARARRGLGQPEQAIEGARKAYDAATRLLGGDSRTTLEALQVLALACEDLKQHDRAEAAWRDLLQRERRVLGNEHPRTLEAINSLAAVLAYDTSRRGESVALFEEVLELRRRTQGAEHPRTLLSMNMLGRMYELAGRQEEALALMNQSVEAGRRVLPADHWYLGLFLRRQGSCLAALHRLPEAEAALEEGARILELEAGHEEESRRARKELAGVRDALAKDAAPPQ